MTRVLRQILDAQGVVLQVQEDDIAFSDIANTPNIVAIQDAPTPTVVPSTMEVTAPPTTPTTPTPSPPSDGESQQ